MKVTLTGACGRLGRPTCQALVEAGHDVLATDRTLRPGMPVDVKLCDLLDRIDCYELVRDCDVLVHTGNYPDAHYGPAQMVFNENVTMNMNIFQAAAEQGVKRFISISSVQAFRGIRTAENRNELPCPLPYLPADGQMPHNPSNYYGLSKVVLEQQLEYFHQQHGISSAALRFPHILTGDLDRWKKYYRGRSLDDLRERSPIDELFSYIRVEDAASLIVALLDAPIQGARRYFPTAPDNTMGWTIDDMLDTFYQGVELRIPREEMTSLVDISEITRDTGWTPTMPTLADLREEATV